MFRRHRQTRKLRRVARVLIELDSGGQRPPRACGTRTRGRAIFGRV